MIRLLLVFLLLFCGKALGDDCEPDLADSCFESIEEHIKYLIDVKIDIVKNITQAALHDLCLSIEDSLNCSSDIIDVDCDGEEGKDSFDIWLLALRSTYKFLCKDDHRNLRNILQGINCWNVDDFVLCTMERAKIQHVRDFLNTDMNEEECTMLEDVMQQCYRSSLSGSCREQRNIPNLVGSMISSFFTPYGCGADNIEPKELHSSSINNLLNSYLLCVCAILLKFYWTTERHS